MMIGTLNVNTYLSSSVHVRGFQVGDRNSPEPEAGPQDFLKFLAKFCMGPRITLRGAAMLVQAIPGYTRSDDGHFCEKRTCYWSMVCCRPHTLCFSVRHAHLSDIVELSVGVSSLRLAWLEDQGPGRACNCAK